MKLLTRIHFICLWLLLADLAMMLIWGMSFRGQLPEILMMVAFLVTPFIGFLFYRKSLKKRTKIYFALYPIYLLICVVACFADRIFFVVMVSPFIIPLMYTPAKTSNADYSIRANMSLMGSEQYTLNRNYFMLEKKIGVADGPWWAPACNDVALKDITESGVSYNVRMNGCGKDTAVNFVKQ